MPKLIKTPKKPKVVSGEGYCRKCQKTLSLNKFYEATNKNLDSNGFMSVCRDCVNDLYSMYFSIHNNVEVALHLTCQDLDVRFSTEVLKAVQTHVEKLIAKGQKGDKVFGYYKSKLSSIVKNNESMELFRYRDSNFTKVESNSTTPMINNNNIECESIEFEYLKAKWGTTLPLENLLWLEQKYNEWYDNYDIQGKSMDLLVQQLCFEEFFVYQERQKGEDVSKRLKSIQDMLKSSKLSPRQETASESAEFQTISEFIKKGEQTKPFVKKNPEFDDPDGFRKMWQSMAGAITRTAGRPDENTKVFDEFFKDSTMDLTNLSNKEGG